MASSYFCQDDDALDLICQRHYGQQAGAVEQVLEVNPHTKDTAHRLTAGTEISLPDLSAQSRAGQLLKLWD